MPFACKGLCKNNEEFFAYKQLSWDKGSRCSVCSDYPDEVWVRIPTHKSFDDFYTALTNEGNNENYYDIKGKQVDVLVLIPVKQMARRTQDEEGTFIKMDDEIVSKVRCPCCHSDCRAGPLSKIKKSREYASSERRVGRPPTSDKKEINELADVIKQSENTMFEPTLEGVSSHKQSKAKEKLKKDNETKTSHVT